VHRAFNVNIIFYLIIFFKFIFGKIYIINGGAPCSCRRLSALTIKLSSTCGSKSQLTFRSESSGFCGKCIYLLSLQCINNL